MRRRTRAREIALQLLYQVDVCGDDALRDVQDLASAESKEPEVREFAVELCRGTLQQRAEIDARIQKIAKNWNIQRMAAIDRNILRMAMYELLHSDGAPPKVVINEAIELGKKFSTQHSGAFVNGILDKAREQIEAERGPTSTDAPSPAPASS